MSFIIFLFNIIKCVIYDIGSDDDDDVEKKE